MLDTARRKSARINPLDMEDNTPLDNDFHNQRPKTESIPSSTRNEVLARDKITLLE